MPGGPLAGSQRALDFVLELMLHPSGDGEKYHRPLGMARNAGHSSSSVPLWYMYDRIVPGT